MNRITFPLFAFLFFSKMLAAQVDTVPPVIICPIGLNLGIPSTSQWCSLTVPAIDFGTFIMDDSPQPVEIGIRKACTGNGFPENATQLTFSSHERGDAKVEVWARDAAGNTSFCIVPIDIYDAGGNCDPATFVTAHTPTAQGIKSVSVDFKGSNCLGDSLKFFQSYILSENNGYWKTWGGIARPGFTTHVTPSKNINPLNGVTTYDLLLISKHILGIEPLDSPFKIIAADANQDGKVTTFDIITLRKLILGIANELPNGKSWRFLPADYNFPNPANPFQTPFPERIEVPNTADPVPSFFAFKGVKIGDVDFSADPKQ